VGSSDGGKVKPSTVGADVVGNFDGAPVGSAVGRLELGRVVGCDVGCLEGVADG
jgi:hypothetical protein